MVKRTRSVAVYEALRELILNGDLKAGERLVTRQIASSYSVSDIPVREALWMLAQDGLVEMSAFSGARVIELTPRDAIELLVVRSALEALAAELAADQLDESGLTRLRDNVEQLRAILAREEDPDPIACAAINRQFHSVILEYSGNHRLSTTVDSVWSEHIQLREIYKLDRAQMNRSLAEHTAILDSLERRDAHEAARLAREHKMRQYRDLVDSFAT